MESSFYEGMTFLAQISLFYTDGHDEDKIMFLKFLNLKVVIFFLERNVFNIFESKSCNTTPPLCFPPPLPSTSQGWYTLKCGQS